VKGSHLAHNPKILAAVVAAEIVALSHGLDQLRGLYLLLSVETSICCGLNFVSELKIETFFNLNIAPIKKLSCGC
jgi:hypothetical protein